MSSTQSEFLNRIATSAEGLRAHAPGSALVVHHNDTDGLSSGAILFLALQALGCKVETLCLEKTYPTAMEAIKEKCQRCNIKILLITDFASGIAGDFI